MWQAFEWEVEENSGSCVPKFALSHPLQMPAMQATSTSLFPMILLLTGMLCHNELWTLQGTDCCWMHCMYIVILTLCPKQWPACDFSLHHQCYRLSMYVLRIHKMITIMPWLLNRFSQVIVIIIFKILSTYAIRQIRSLVKRIFTLITGLKVLMRLNP